MNKLKLKRLIYRIQHDYLTLNNVVIAAAILIAMSWAWGSIESMQKNYELQRSIDNKRQQVEIEKLQVALLEYESKYYQSEEYQELTIRQRTGKGLPGEKTAHHPIFRKRHARPKIRIKHETDGQQFPAMDELSIWWQQS